MIHRSFCVLLRLCCRVSCAVFGHNPAFDSMLPGHKKYSGNMETLCLCCGRYLCNGSVTHDPDVKERVDEFLKLSSRIV